MDHGSRSKCFVCQSKYSKSQSADEDEDDSEKTTKIDSYNHLDSSTWRTFCQYFYPIPVVGLPDSSTFNSPKNENEDFSLPVFCESCCQTVFNLCYLHSQLEFIQIQISKIVAKVALTFLQEENHENEEHDDDDDDESDDDLPLSQWISKAKEQRQRQYDDNIIYSMRSVIRQRYQPLVSLTRCNIDIPNQDDNEDGASCNNLSDLELGEQLSPLSAHSNLDDLDLDFDFDVDFFQSIKQEAEDSKSGNEEHLELNNDEIINQSNPDPDADHLGESIEKSENSGRKRRRKKRKLKKRQKRKFITPHFVVDSDDSDFYADENQHKSPRSNSVCNPNPDPDPDPDSNNNNKLNADNEEVSLPSSNVESIFQPTAYENESQGNNNHIKGKALIRPKDVKVGENIYEHRSRWRYEKKEDQNGNVQFHCLSCHTKPFSSRYNVIAHIYRLHKTAREKLIEAQKKAALPKTKSPKKVKKIPRGPSKDNHQKVVQPANEPQVGDNIFEYGGQWSYGQRLDETGSSPLFYCLLCSKTCNKRYLLLRHINRLHLNSALSGPTPRMQKLDDNNFLFDGFYPVTRVTEPNGIFFKCGTCGSKKKTMQSIRTHLIGTHIDGKKWICEICGFACTEQRSLRLHKKNCHAEKPQVKDRKYICEVCGKCFNSKVTLNGHREVHTGQKYFCQCGLSFVYSNGLRRHRRQANHPAPQRVDVEHTPEAPFLPKQCGRCKRVFVKEENLQRHAAVCEGLVKCDWCGRRSYLSMSLHKQFKCRERFLFANQKQRQTQNPTDESSRKVHIVSVENPLDDKQKIGEEIEEDQSASNSVEDPVEEFPKSSYIYVEQ